MGAAAGAGFESNSRSRWSHRPRAVSASPVESLRDEFSFSATPPFASHPFPTGRATLIRLSISDFTRDYIYDLQCTPVKAMTSWTKILGLWFSGKGIITGNTFFSSIEGISEVKITFFWYCYFYRNMSALIIMGVAGIFSLRGQIYNFVNITSKANMFNFI